VTVRKPGHPRGAALLRDGAQAAVAQPVATAAALLVVALVCVVVLVTAGRTAATEQQVLASIDDAGSRLVVVSDATGSARLRSDSVAAMAALDGVTWALGLGPATDGHVAMMGTARGVLAQGVPVRPYVGGLPPDASLVTGRLPQRPGEAIAGATAAARLGLADGAGPVVVGDGMVAVVGTARMRDALSGLDDTILVRDDGGQTVTLKYVYVTVDSAARATSVARALEAVVHADRPDQLAVETPTAVAQLREVVSGRLGAGSRQLLAAVLAVGVVVVGITMLGMVASRRRDFGRRRALGASRSAIVVLVLVHAGIAASAGAVLGTAVGAAIVRGLTGVLPAPAYLAGMAALTVLAALVGSAPPALLAALRDPVRILRVP
jgi:putative ABC transport system permease protein